MRKAIILILFIGIIFWGVQIFALQNKIGGARERYNESKQALFRATNDSEKLKADLEYFLKPSNLEKELRSRFNYRKPDEKLIIIVPESQQGEE